MFYVVYRCRAPPCARLVPDSVHFGSACGSSMGLGADSPGCGAICMALAASSFGLSRRPKTIHERVGKPVVHVECLTGGTNLSLE